MICLNCGYCCMMLDVIIISPKAIDTLNITSLSEIPYDEFEKLTEHKETGIACPHLTYENDKYLCRIHDKPWFKETPCHRHVQIEDSNSNCRTGNYINSDGNFLKIKLKQIFEKETVDGN